MNESELHYKKMTETPVAKLIVKLGIPTTVAMLITSIYNMADTYFVGGIEPESPAAIGAQGAIGVLFTLQSIIQAVAYMLGHGCGTFVAKELANKNREKASVYISSSFFLGGTIGIVFAIVGGIVLTPLLRLLGATDGILPYAKQYAMWVLISCPFLICSLIMNNNLRYEGKALFAMIGIGTGGLLNIFGDWLLVRKCNMGVFGAGLSTAVSQTVSFVILLVLHIKTAQSKISFKSIGKSWKIYFSIFKNGFPSFIRQTLNSVSGGVLNNLAGHYGGLTDNADATIAAMTIVNKIANFVMCVGMGISQGLQPVASFNYQAKQYTRVKKALKISMLICFVCVAVLAIPTMIFPREIVMFFQEKTQVADIAAPALRYAMAGLLFMPLFIPLNMMFQSIRKAIIASVLALLRSGVAFIPIIFVLSRFFGILGIQIAQPAADVLTALVNVPFLIWFLKTTPETSDATNQNNDEQAMKNFADATQDSNDAKPQNITNEAHKL